MAKTIVIIGSLDSKGLQLQYLKERIVARGHKALMLDVSMGSVPRFTGDITQREIAAAAGRNIDDVLTWPDRFTRTETMTEGARQTMRELYARGEVDGVVSLGGSTMNLLGSRVMRTLPFGIPKVIATSAAQTVYIKDWFESMDVLVMQMILEFTGMNELLKHGIGQVAGVICGMVEESRPAASLKLSYPSVAITEIGFSPRCTRETERLLEAEGFHVCTFHAQGISERALDRLVGQGFFDGVIDIVPAGVIEEMYGGNRPAGKERLDAICERGIPLVLAPCCINLTGCGPTRTNRELYASRPQIPIDGMRGMTRYNDDELKAAAPVYAEKLNRSKGPVRFVFPMKGWSNLDHEGTILYDPEKDRVFIEALSKHLDPRIAIVEVPYNLEDQEFARALVDNFETIFGKGSRA